MLTYEHLKEKAKEFLVATGLTVAEFDFILPVFRADYANLLKHGITRKGKPRQRREGGGVKEKLRKDTNCFSSWFIRKLILYKPCTDCNLG